MRYLGFLPSFKGGPGGILLAACAAALALSACTSTPEASAGRDAEAKQFIAHPATAALYVYRTDFVTEEMMSSHSVLWLDGRLIGSTLPRTYFRIDARPGRRVLHGDGPDTGRLAVDVQAGEIYFVSLNAQGGTSRFALMKPDAGKREILRCCTLLESWTPGQRPFLK